MLFLKIKEIVNPLVFLTGGFLLSEYSEILSKYNFVDGVLLDFTSDALVDILDGKTYIEDLAYREGYRIICNHSENKYISYPTPKHELFNLKQYRLPHGKRCLFSCIITNFGCPYKCGFCIAQNVKYKMRDSSEIIIELAYLKSLGIEEVFIKDFTFGVDKNSTIRLCEQIKKM